MLEFWRRTLLPWSLLYSPHASSWNNINEFHCNESINYREILVQFSTYRILNVSLIISVSFACSSSEGITLFFTICTIFVYILVTGERVILVQLKQNKRNSNKSSRYLFITKSTSFFKNSGWLRKKLSLSCACTEISE